MKVITTACGREETEAGWNSWVVAQTLPRPGAFQRQVRNVFRRKEGKFGKSKEKCYSRGG